MDLHLTDTVCVVTGASRGIGRAVSVGLAAEGARVLLVARNESTLDEVRADCPGSVALSLDITGAEAGERLLAACVERLGSPGVLVNCAGSTASGGTTDIDDDTWRAQWEEHVLAPMRLMRAFAPAMAAAGSGRIVNVSSASGKRPQAANASYSVAKAGQLSLSRVFAEEYAARGVRVNAIAPGPVDTDIWHAEGGLADAAARRAGSSRDEALEQARAGVPIGRFSTPAEIAAVVCLLCSPRADAVAGAAWSVDGGAFRSII